MKKIEILSKERIKKNSKAHIAKLNHIYDEKINFIFKKEKKLISGYMNENYNFEFIYKDMLANIILEYYFGLAKEEIYSFCKHIEQLYNCKFMSYNFTKNKAATVKIHHKKNDIYSVLKLEDLLLLNNDLKNTIKLHKSSYYKVENLCFYKSFFITKYLLENDANINVTSLLKCYLISSLDLTNFRLTNLKIDMLNSINNISYIIALMITKSKTCFEKEQFLITLFKNIETLDIDLLQNNPLVDMIQQVQKIYLGHSTINKKLFLCVLV